MKKVLLFTLLLAASGLTELFAQDVWYIRRTPPEPWTWAPILNDNINEMNTVFGAGGWNSDYYTTVDVATAFGPTSKYVFLEGGDDHAIPMNTFLTANLTAIYDWVYQGGHLFMNAAPNYGTSMDWGLDGVTLSYPDYSSSGFAVALTHPIFLGPYSPVGTTWTGNYFGHSTVEVPCGFTLIENEYGDVLCSERTYGMGVIIYGGMTSTSWHAPAPNASNLRKNIHEYLANMAEPFFVSTYFTYPDSIYCQYEDNPLPELGVGSDPGIFEATPVGLVIDSITGEVDLGASTPGTYTITNTVAVGGCEYLSAFEFTVSDTPTADAGPDQNICKGTTANLDGSGGLTYLWTPPVYLDDPALEDPTVIAPPTNVFYQLIAYDVNGCADTDDVAVFLYPDPIIDAGEDEIMVLGGFTELNATGGVSYVWAPAESLSDPNISNPTAFPEDTTIYVVTGTDLNGCIGTDTVIIFVIEESDITTPNAFTPNGDGLNDSYKPSFMGLGTITDFSIYNRWGALLYFTADPSVGWDGNYNGTEQEVGNYIVVIKAENQFGEPLIKTGTVALLR
ncbi:MAG: gliding motility-associated C-terminal domain-containing protein [Bacteroidetes bacterium]|nr:gliding motility-associated C-terminal domain-containing protein [Bacteroidota bacterium]